MIGLILQKESVDMYNIGDDVIYSSQGVFRVVDIRELDVLGAVHNYYVLKENDSMSASEVFVPIGGDTERNVIRPLMTVDEANLIIDQYNSVPPCAWIDSARPRASEFKKLIDSGDRLSLISLIKAVDMKQAERIDSGKKPFLADEHTRQRAIKLLCSELACVLGTDIELIKTELGIS